MGTETSTLPCKGIRRKKLVRLIRRIAREEAYKAIDEHLDEYMHTEKPAEEALTP